MSSDLFREEALDYQSASNSRFGKPTGIMPPAWSRITFLLACFIGALLIFLFTVDFARKEKVRGKLRVDGAEAKVYALEAGRISNVMVIDGQSVSAGDPVAQITTERLMSDGEALSETLLAELNCQDLANMAWAFACVDSRDAQFFSELMGAAATKHPSDECLSQFYVVLLHCRLEWPDLSFPVIESQQTLQEAYQRWEDTPSRLQRGVAAALDRIGWAHVFEHVTAEGLSLDMAQPHERRAVEVDGPSHYLKDTQGRCVTENGPTRFKSRLLRRLGWDVAHVPFFEWPHGSVAQDSYLRAKLASFPLVAPEVNLAPC
ncbi:MAG: RAP domain-containing protein [Pseudomonadota bacterium]